MQIVVGQTLGRYRIERRLGRGGMGEVFAAHDTRLDRPVAIKVLLPEVAGDSERLERFEREAKAIAALDHPNIVTIFSVESVGETRFLTMELVDGKPLTEVIPAGGLDLDDLFRLAIPLTDALAAAHARGIVHRDLKPANIMIGRDGRVRVLDFGLAKHLQSSDSSLDLTAAETAAVETQDGVVLGTVGYMSPEQVRGQTVDQRSDVFALGIVLFEMAVGQRPFRADNAPDTLSAILRDSPPAIDSVRSEMPHHLGRITRRCLEKNPDRRYASAREIHTELEDLATELRTEQILEEHDRSGAIAAPSRRRPWGLVAAVGVAALLFLAIVVQLTRRESASDGLAGDAGIRSLAVLPFDNLMNDPEQEYFVEGMHEALITDLAKVGALRVISRTSTVRYKDSDLTLPEIARELDVDALVEGSVLLADGQVRITAQLIDGASDEHLWVESYDRELENVLALLSGVAQAIAREIAITMTPGQEERLASAPSVDPRAYEVYLRGQHHFNRGDLEGFRQALGPHRQAVEIDPDFARGWAALATSYLVHGFFRISDPAEAIPKARAAARRALELDESQGTAHGVLGYVALFFDWDWPTAKRELELGIALDPTSMMSFHAYADYLGVFGECDRAVEQVERGRRYDPMGVWANLFVIGHLTYCRRYDEAIEEGRRALELGIDSYAIRDFVAEALWLSGRYEDALAEWSSTLGSEHPSVRQMQRGYAEGGARGAMLAKAQGLAALAEQRPINPFSIALTFAAAGEADPAFDWLETAFAQRTPQLLHLTFHPELDSIRQDPRFADLLRRIGIPSARD